MIRTQVYLSEQLASTVRFLANASRKPKAVIIRIALSEGLRTLAVQQLNGGTGLVRLAELGEQLRVQGPKELSSTIDQILYDAV